MEIKITIANKHCTVHDAPVIVCGNPDYTILFEFDEEWDQVAEKYARFSYVRGGRRLYQDAKLTGDTVAVPPMHGIKELQVGVYSEGIATTTPGRIFCEKSILCDTHTPDDMTQQQFDILFEYLGDIETALDSILAIQAELLGGASV